MRKLVPFGADRCRGELDPRDLRHLVVDVAVHLEDGRSGDEHAHQRWRGRSVRRERGARLGRSHGAVMVPTARAGTWAAGLGAVRLSALSARDRRDTGGTVNRCASPTPSRPGSSRGSPAMPVAAVRRGRTHGGRRRPRRGRRGARAPTPSRLLDDLAPGFWVGWCAFELGHALERVVARRRRHATTRSSPMSVFARFDAVAVVDERRRGHRARRRSRPAACSSAPPRAWRRRPATPSPGADRERRVADEPRSRRVRDRVDDHPRAAPRRRVLPGEPHPAAHVRPRARPRRAVRRARAHASGALHRAAAPPDVGPGDRGRVGVAGVLPARRDGATVETPPDQGHRRRRARAAGERQGPRRERDDRRPRPQRPRARVRARVDPRARRCARSSRTPGCTTS